MDNCADTLRRRIALYRNNLAQGVSADLAAILLHQIVEAEGKLRRADADRRAAYEGDPAREPFGLEYWRS